MSQLDDGTLASLRPKLFKIAWRYTRDYTLADDIVQITMMRAWEKRDQYRGESSLFSWMYTILMNVCRSHFRQERGKQRRIYIPLDPADEFMTTNENPEWGMIFDQRIEILHRAINLAKLGPTERQCIEDFLEEDYPNHNSDPLSLAHRIARSRARRKIVNWVKKRGLNNA